MYSNSFPSVCYVQGESELSISSVSLGLWSKRKKVHAQVWLLPWYFTKEHCWFSILSSANLASFPKSCMERIPFLAAGMDRALCPRGLFTWSSLPLCSKQPLSPHPPDSHKTCTGTEVNVWPLLFLMGSFDTPKPFYILWERSGIKQPSSVIDTMVSQTWVEQALLKCVQNPLQAELLMAAILKTSPHYPGVILLCAMCQIKLSQTSNN